MAKDINIKIKADSKEAQSGLNKATTELNKFTKSVKGSDVSKFAKSFTSATGAISGAVVAFKKVVAVVKETTEAYKTQIKAETQLETAVQNNPYLSKNSVTALKEYASYLQSISTVGDEQLIPMMAQLASAGRTQEEIQKIMSAALDVSASGMMSLDSAVTALNKTYSGSVGLLGNQIDGLKGLTTEQLKNGDAVDIVAAKYKGMAEETAKVTGSYEQMKNAQGDYLEVVGKFAKPTSDLWNNFWKGWYERGIESIQKLEANINAGTIGKKLVENITSGMEDLSSDFKGQTRFVRESLNLVTDEELSAIDTYLGKLKKYSPEQTRLVELLSMELQSRKEVIAIEEEQAKAKEERVRKEKEEEELKQKQEERDNKALDFMNKNQAALDKRLEQMRIEAELKGEEVDQQEVLNAMMDSYIQLVTGSDLVTENNPFSQKRLAELLAYADGIEKVAENTADWRKQLSDLKDYLSEAQRITADATELFLGSIQEQTEAHQGELAQQYTDGIISYEEYCEKKKQIDKKAAQEEYKLKMWEWTSSLLAATANIAQGVSAALAGTPPASYIMAALTAASGAIQIATLTENRPKPPRFKNGGYVPGASYSGDNVPIMANSGELILNSKEQAVLRQFMGNTGNSGAVVNMPVTIENNANANVSTNFSQSGLKIVIDEIVNSSMASGTYTKSMEIAQSKSKGLNYF